MSAGVGVVVGLGVGESLANLAQAVHALVVLTYADYVELCMMTYADVCGRLQVWCLLRILRRRCMRWLR